MKGERGKGEWGKGEWSWAKASGIWASGARVSEASASEARSRGEEQGKGDQQRFPLSSSSSSFTIFFQERKLPLLVKKIL